MVKLLGRGVVGAGGGGRGRGGGGGPAEPGVGGLLHGAARPGPGQRENGHH